MDATLGAREPLAPSGGPSRSRSASARDTSTSPAEPLIAEPLLEESTGTAETSDDTGAAATKRLPTAEELYAAPASTDAGAAAVAAAAASTDTTPPVGAAPVGAAVAAPADTPTERLAADTTDTDQEAAVDSTTARETRDQPTDATETPATAAPAASASDATRGTPAATAAGAQSAHGRTVGDLADRLDDSRFFSSLFDFTFTNYVTRKLAGPVYVVGLVLIALGIIVGFANSLTSAIATHAPIGAFVFLFGVLITLVGAMLSVLLLRVGIEVFCAIIEIAQNTRRRRPPGE
jgi:hypothetical protein